MTATNQSEDQQVSWQSIFWALLALMTYSMGQLPLSQNHLTFDISTISLLYSSPIICLLSSLEIWLDFITSSILLCSIHKAASRVQRRRVFNELLFEHGPITDERPNIPRVSVNWVFVSIGPISQAIKLFGCRGIGWAQILAAMYLSYPLTLTLLATLASADWYTHIMTTGEHGELSNSMYEGEKAVAVMVFTGVGQVLLYFWLFVGSAIKAQERYATLLEESWLGSTGVQIAVEFLILQPMWFGCSFFWIVGFVVPCLAIPVGVFRTLVLWIRAYLGWKKATFRKLLCLHCCLVPTMAYEGMSAISLLMWMPMGRKYASKAEFLFLLSTDLPPVIRIYVLVVLIYLFCICVVMVLSHKRRASKSGELEIEFTAFFAMTNLLSLVFFCWMGYEVQGTVKPAWTEALG